ncbi:MAG: ATP-binding protein [Kofleriaceae bacterium]|nr:ATP-binding protein [Kofleriaceae bacterium]
MSERLLVAPDRSFLLFGPRGVGKSTWLRTQFAQALWFDLLDSSVELSLMADPASLAQRVEHLPAKSWVCIDEVQKIPALLDQVHALSERKKLRFALTGSSARKLRRGGANLLAGRANVLTMRPFSLQEVGDLPVNWHLEVGLLPMVVNEPKHARAILSAYVHTYLKEEIRAEGLVRKVEPFVRFLRVAGIMNGQILNLANIARDAAVPRNSVETYFSILEDTLVGTLLPAYQPGARVREVGHPKFFWFDAGVARAAAGLINDPVDTLWTGFAFESWVLHEINVYNETAERNRLVAHYRTGAGVEVDFLVETKKKTLSAKAEVVLIEAKSAKKWKPAYGAHMRSLVDNGSVKVKACIGVYLGTERLTVEGVSVFPLHDFVQALYEGAIF